MEHVNVIVIAVVVFSIIYMVIVFTILNIIFIVIVNNYSNSQGYDYHYSQC